MPFVRTYSKFILPILCSVVSSYAHSAEQDHGEQKDGKGTEETRVTSGRGSTNNTQDLEVSEGSAAGQKRCSCSRYVELLNGSPDNFIG